jgi:ATP-dependent Lon protease
MPTESSNKMSKKGMNKKTEKNIKKKKNNNNPDSDSDTGSDSDLESDKMDVHEFRKCIKKIFPSKNLDKKIKDGERLKKLNSPKKSSSKKHKHQIEDDDDDDDDEDYTEDDDSNEEYTDVSDDEEEEEEEDELKNKPKKNSKKHSKKNKHESSEDESSVSSEEIESNNKPSNKVNIVLTIGKSKYDDEEYDDESDEEYTDSSEEDNVTEDEDEEVSTDESDSEDEKPIRKKEKKNKGLKIANNNNVTEIDKKMEELVKNDDSEVLKQLKELFAKNKNDKYIGKCIQDYETDIKLAKTKRDKKETKQKKKNVRIFKKIISDKHTMNDFQFYEKLELDHQKKLIKELKEINKISRVEKPYRMTLLDSDMPVRYKAAAIKKINSLKYMDSGSGEFYKVKNWVDTFMTIPFNKYAELPISIEDGVNKCHEFMENAQKTLDEAIYGLNDAKMQIMQMLGQLLTNPKSIGTAIAIHGPAGTGKTSIVKEGISKILNRPFAFIALGGATDSSFLEGHGYTYEGSTWGKIVQILIDSKCMNPVIYFDELDKISDTPRGEEIAGILTHLTDTSQNSQFHDKYFSDVDFDLSKCLFIFSYNDESKINPILKDRMYRIKTKGYSGKEKTVIANNYLLPKIREQVKFGDGDITIPDTVLGYINETHCQKEDGVRNMKRCLEIIHTKLNLYRLMKPGSNLFEGEMSLNVTFPFNVTREIVDKLIKKESDGMELWRTLYV